MSKIERSDLTKLVTSVYDDLSRHLAIAPIADTAAATKLNDFIANRLPFDDEMQVIQDYIQALDTIIQRHLGGDGFDVTGDLLYVQMKILIRDSMGTRGAEFEIFIDKVLTTLELHMKNKELWAMS